MTSPSLSAGIAPPPVGSPAAGVVTEIVGSGVEASAPESLEHADSPSARMQAVAMVSVRFMVVSLWLGAALGCEGGLEGFHDTL